MYLWLVRHGETIYNQADRIQGVSDASLTPAGLTAAQSLGRGLVASGCQFDAAFVSPLWRAVSTAHAILTAQATPPELVPVANLHEEDYGHFETVPAAERRQAMRAALGAGYPAPDQWTLAKLAHAVVLADRAGGGTHAETAGTVQRRMQQAMTTIVAQAGPATNVLVVGHGSALLLWLQLLGANQQQVTLGNCSVSRVRWQDQRFTLETLDERQFITAGQ